MSLEVVQPQLFTNRRGNPFDSSTSLTARFSAIFRDFPNTGPPTAESGYFSAGVAGAGWSGFDLVGSRAMGEVDDS
jgi:hypothetical protein